MLRPRSFGISVYQSVLTRDASSKQLTWLIRFPVLEVPYMVVSDFGHESARVLESQVLFWGDADAQRRMYSINNTTIERFWGQMTDLCTATWREHLQNLIARGDYDPDNFYDYNAMVSTYLPVIQQSLDEAAATHNAHRVRYQRGRIRPAGRPDDMWRFPEQFGGIRCGLTVDDAAVDWVKATLGIGDVDATLVEEPEVGEVVQNWMNLNQVVLTRENVQIMYWRVKNLLRIHF